MTIRISLLIVAILSFAHSFAQQDTTYICMGDTTGYHYGLGFVDFDGVELNNLVPDSVLWIVESATTAKLEGNFIKPNQPENGFTIDIQFVSGKNWDEWSNQFYPTGFLNDNNAVTDEHEEWMFYIIDELNATLSGFGSFEGSELVLSQAPANYFYGYQVGLGANQQEVLVEGQGGWAYVQGTIMNSELGVSNEEFDSSIGLYLTFGCEGTAQSVIGLNQAQATFSVYPNPAHNSLQIGTSSSYAGERVSFTIIDTQGKIVSAGSVISNSIDISGFASGLYTITLTAGDASEQLRFVKR